MRVARAAGVVTAVLLLLASCTGNANHGRVKLDGSPRIPNDEGVATSVSRTRIVLDGKRAYRVDPAFISFSTYTGELVPLVSRRGQYVQLGLRGKTAMWLAGIAAVITSPEPAVYYIGNFTRLDSSRRAMFADGTVLRLAKDVQVPKTKAKLRARIDPSRHQVVELLALG